MVAAKRFPGCISYYLTLSDTDFVELQKHYESGGGGGGVWPLNPNFYSREAVML